MFTRLGELGYIGLKFPSEYGGDGDPVADAVREVTMAKLATQRAAFDVIDTCLQIHGGNGYMAEYGLERAARDSRLGPIGGGTDEIMREVLGRSMGL